MQVFIIGTPLETAMALSRRHLNNQINEASIILDALNGVKAWSNHPCVLQYRGYEMWLGFYKYCLEYYVNGLLRDAKIENDYAESRKPPFHTEEYFDQMKRRLYTKDKEHYKQWAYLGESEENYYYVDGQWRIYKNGKRIQ